MDFNVGSPSFIKCPEVQNVLQPAFPAGCMVKVNLGNIDFASLAGSVGGNYPRLGYTVDNANWQDSNAIAQIPFSDEETYLSTGDPGGLDCYGMELGGILRQNNGKVLLAFYMFGSNDASHYVISQQPATVYERIRIFEYDPATEIATQKVKVTCVIYHSSDFPTNVVSFSDWRQAISMVAQQDGSITVEIAGYTANGLFQAFYRDTFAEVWI
jgi:hypothetical protein